MLQFLVDEFVTTPYPAKKVKFGCKAQEARQPPGQMDSAEMQQPAQDIMPDPGKATEDLAKSQSQDQAIRDAKAKTAE